MKTSKYKKEIKATPEMEARATAKANRSIELGSKVAFEALYAFFLKGEINAVKNAKAHSKRNDEKAYVATLDLQPLWGEGSRFSTQSEYQRSKLGSKWN